MRDMLEAAARECGLVLTGDMLDALTEYWRYLVEVNAHMNLTAVTSDEEAVWRHFMDSLAPVRAGLLPPGARVLDLGSGAGFPGIPLCVARPDLDITLLDSLKKRVDFLNEAARRIGAHTHAVHARAEEAAKGDMREYYDVVTARAVARLNVLVELALPFLRVGGTLIAYKGPAADEELSQAGEALRRLGGGEAHVLPAGVPGRDSRLIVVRKLRPTPRTFPRKPGEATRKPL